MVGNPYEVIDHAVGQAAEPERHRRQQQAAARLEVQHQGHPAGRLVERMELPTPFQATEGPVAQVHVGLILWRQPVLGREPGARGPGTRFLPGDHALAVLFQLL